MARWLAPTLLSRWSTLRVELDLDSARDSLAQLWVNQSRKHLLNCVEL
jgi:hypothetical protein